MKLASTIVLLQCGYAFAQVLHPDTKHSWLSFNEATVDDLAKEFPMVSRSTVQRFYDIYGGRTSARLIPEFVEWKTSHTLPAVASDTERWNLAVQQAFQYLTKPAHVRKSKQTPPTTLPKAQVIYETNHTDHKGYHVFQVLPMRMDLSLDDSVEVYGDILAGYLESYLVGQPPATQVTIMCDIRAGRGKEWSNPPLTKTVPAVEAIAKRLIHLHPEQMHRAIIYPVPMMGAPLYDMAKPFLGHELTDLITMVDSDEGASRHAPPPKAALLDYVDDETVEDMEAFRLDLFHPKN